MPDDSIQADGKHKTHTNDEDPGRSEKEVLPQTDNHRTGAGKHHGSQYSIHAALGSTPSGEETATSMGRSPYQSAFARESADDRQRVDDALAHVDISALATRSFATLSGGEKQRALIARALVQEAGVLILDEPTNHLDIRHQFEVLDLVRGVGATTLTSIHDVNLAAEYCDYIVVLKGGRVQAVGPVETVLTPQVLEPQTRVWGDSRMRSAGRGGGGPCSGSGAAPVRSGPETGYDFNR
ncbi:MAG: ABC transporter ATP-binding protein [Acidimicrobiia bacterium]|nr:ABC transporter ATP-binding protein [Acidimicrobiia bacterium]